jgi:hypothetical protein
MIAIANKLLARLLVVLFISMFAHARTVESCDPAKQPIDMPQSSSEPNFRAEIHSLTEDGPQIVLTNLSEEPLTACYLQTAFWKVDRKPSGQLWDVLVQNLSPLVKDAEISIPLVHMVGESYPDKVEVAAAVWADGTTFGRPDLLKRILISRASRANSLDQIISLMQTGIQQDWTRDQFLAALDGKSLATSVEASSLKSTLQANPNMETRPRVRQRIIQLMLDTFSRRRDALRQSKPDFNTPINPA